MIDTGSKQPLLLQLLGEQRKFANAVLELYPDKVTPEQLAEHQNDELKRRAAGARASTLKKILTRKGILNDKEAEAALRKARSSPEGFIAAKDMEAFRKAQQEAGATR